MQLMIYDPINSLIFHRQQYAMSVFQTGVGLFCRPVNDQIAGGLISCPFKVNKKGKYSL